MAKMNSMSKPGTIKAVGQASPKKPAQPNAPANQGVKRELYWRK